MLIENKPDLKYRYAMFTWGGFYNEEYQKIRKEEEGLRIFDTLEERTECIEYLRVQELTLSRKHLMIVLDEGFAVGTQVVMHRVIKLNNKYYYSEDTVDVWPASEDDGFSRACYHMAHKWYPGFNDYPAGEDVDYEHAEIIQEWITGAFKADNDGLL